VTVTHLLKDDGRKVGIYLFASSPRKFYSNYPLFEAGIATRSLKVYGTRVYGSDETPIPEKF
jgi:hypothetical protein